MENQQQPFQFQAESLLGSSLPYTVKQDVPTGYAFQSSKSNASLNSMINTKEGRQPSIENLMNPMEVNLNQLLAVNSLFDQRTGLASTISSGVNSYNKPTKTVHSSVFNGYKLDSHLTRLVNKKIDFI